jgi:hypothetical protein
MAFGFEAGNRYLILTAYSYTCTLANGLTAIGCAAALLSLLRSPGVLPGEWSPGVETVSQHLSLSSM